MKERILVIGATGTVGSALVRCLAARGHVVRAASRRPPAPSDRSTAAQGALSAEPSEWVELDFEKPATFAPALARVDRLFLMARPGDDHADECSLPLIDEAKRQGVHYVVNLTALGVERLAGTALRRIELHLEASGLSFTHLRPNFFMQVLATGPLQVAIRDQGVLAIPAADARISYIDAGDIAEVAAAALASDKWAGSALALTGPEALAHDEVARIVAEASGRPVRYLPLDEETARAGLMRAGLSTERTERLLGFYRLVRAGACAPVSPAVGAVLGRPPVEFAEFARKHRQCWGGV